MTRAALSTTRSTDKRERLLEAARDLFHRRGIERTALADIAKAADVPLGNVYYYFKAKDDIVRAVIAAHLENLQAVLRTFDCYPSPRDRLIAFTREVSRTGPDVARHGCPHGSLCSELGNRTDDLAEASAALMRIRLDWARQQFRLLGRKDADELALTLNSIVQGASVLANACSDPSVLRRQMQYAQRWINALP